MGTEILSEIPSGALPEIGEWYRSDARPEMRLFLPTNAKRVLEVGCGYACFLRGIKNAELWGVEPNRKAANEAQKFVFKVLVGFFDEVKSELPKGYFDLIICNDVIEHMDNCEDFVSVIKQFLSPGGIIIGSIPNIRYYKTLAKLLIAKDWKYTDCGVLDRTHLRFFTKKSLISLFERHNYIIDRIEGINGEIQKERTSISTFFAIALIIATFGYYSDIRHMQFAFCVRPN